MTVPSPRPWRSGLGDPIAEEQYITPLPPRPRGQALPAYSKHSQPNGKVLLQSLLTGNIWVENAIPNDGSTPGGTGQDFRPSPGQGKDEVTGPFIPLPPCT